MNYRIVYFFQVTFCCCSYSRFHSIHRLMATNQEDSDHEETTDIISKDLGRTDFDHEVKCDSCGLENLVGYRYQCAICTQNFCSNCFEDRKETDVHKNNHPLKVIRSPDDDSNYRKLFSLGLGSIQAYLYGKEVIHDVVCKSCENDERIRGLLFICDDCRGYRLCYSCYKGKKAVNDHQIDHCLVIRVSPRSYELSDGTQISLMKKLGAGSFGEVYKCTVNDKAIAAVKICKTQNLSTLSKKERKSLENEIRLYQEFFCEYIVEIAGFGMGSNNQLCLLLEYLSCGNLEDLIKSATYERVSKRRRFFFCENIIRGLFRMHKKGIIHKDLKPDNIFLTKHVTLKLGDLGIAFNPDYTSQEVKYMQQQLYYPTNNPNIFHPSYDIYAFGIIFNEIMTGERNTGLTQGDCRDPNAVPYFGSLISACISEYGRDRPTTYCVKEHLLKFHNHLDNETAQCEKSYESEDLGTRNEIFDKAYRTFQSNNQFVSQKDQTYQEHPSREG